MTRAQLQFIKETKSHDAKIIADLKKRKLLNTQKVISFKVSKGPKFALEIVKEETDLTADMLASGSWKSANFSQCYYPTGGHLFANGGDLEPYNFKALGANQVSGALHPLNKMRHEFRLVDFNGRSKRFDRSWVLI